MTLRFAVQHRFRDSSVSVAFDADVPSVVALFGPSGSGKTSVLNAMAGLLPKADVRLELHGVALHMLPPERRRVGYVFQDGRLFPHRRVRGNLLYGLQRAPRGAPPGPASLDEVVTLLGIGHLLMRWPHSLSGGERQRVAIGRALLSQPRLLLMDEPLSALDAARKEEILPYLARLRGAFRLPIVYASHALDEVVRLADTLVLLENGRVRAAGPMTELISRVGLPLAQRDDACGVLMGRIAAHAPERGLTGIACGADFVWVPLVAAPEGTDLRLRIAAREVMLATGEPRAVSVTNMLPARVTEIAPMDGGRAGLVQLGLDGGGQLLSRVTWDAVQRLGLRHGMHVLALIKAVSVELQT